MNTRCLERNGVRLATVKRDPKRAGMWTTVQAARALHTSRNGIHYLCRTGALAYERDEKGNRWFDPGEVKACAAARGIEAPYTGRVCAQVFELFDAGTPLPQIVKQLGILPEQVRKLWLEYITPLGRDVPRMVRFVTKEEKLAAAEHEKELRRLDAELRDLIGLPKQEPDARMDAAPNESASTPPRQGRTRSLKP